MPQVVFFTESEFTKRDFDRYGVQALQNDGMEVLVYDLSQIYFSNLKKGEAFQFSGYKMIRDLRDFKFRMKTDIKNGYFFWVASLNLKLVPYFLSIPKTKLKRLVLMQGHLPAIEKTWPERRQELKKTALNPTLLFFRLEMFLLPKILKLIKLDSPARAYFCAGSKIEESVKASGQVIPIGSYDYNLFLKYPPTGKKEFIVFLDENEPFHPDFDRQKIKKVSQKKYFDELLRVFEHFEKKYNRPVVIAAHPTANLSHYQSYFNGRVVQKGMTVELIRDSFGVLAHTSTALQFAFLYEKPMCCFMNDDMIYGYRKNLKRAYDQMGFRFINMSHSLEVEQSEFQYDDKLAARYLKELVRSDPNEKKDSWEKVIDYINSQEQKTQPI